MRVALVHDWLTGLRGGEKCLQAFLQIYPQADIYTLLHVPGSTAAEIDQRVKQASFLQRIPGARRFYRALLPLYPRAAASLRLAGYDLVVSLSHAAAKNVDPGKGAFHICYCFTHMRYIWDQARYYLGAARMPAWPLIQALRNWDEAGSRRVDRFAAISTFVKARIRCFYGRNADVIYPPVEAGWIERAEEGAPGAAFLYAGALVPYKRVDLVVEAFNRLGAPLWIVGSGPQADALKSRACGNITFFGQVSDTDLAGLYRRARALIFPAVEDFGMVPVECMAAGRPVIGLDGGGLRESVQGVRPWLHGEAVGEGATGVFIRRKNRDEVAALLEAVEFFMRHEEEFSAAACRRRAELFAPGRFFKGWQQLLTDAGLPLPLGVPGLQAGLAA